MGHECRHLLPCYHLPHGCYAEIKAAIGAGAGVTDEEAAFTGFASSTRAPADGWRDVNMGLSTFELSGWEVDTQTAADMAVLMSVGTRRDGIEFVSDGWY